MILLVASLIVLVVFTVISFYVLSSGSSNWVNEMWSHMGGMMGGTPDVAIQNPAATYFMVMVVVLVGVVIVSVGGLVYFFMFPEIKTDGQTRSGERGVAQDSTAYEAIVKTLTTEESKVIQVLKTHEGRYLQKYIRKEAGLSRLKTHRILVRLADRGIVTLRKTGNTNEVQLSEWLNK
ncbi:MAG: helix-turn-helix transcriptional regulator [Candidatus Bathyarchaeia archaeon]